MCFKKKEETAAPVLVKQHHTLRVLVSAGRFTGNSSSERNKNYETKTHFGSLIVFISFFFFLKTRQ